MKRATKLSAIAGLTMLMAPLATSAQAAEIILTSSTAMREVVEELAAMFERASGNKVTMSFQSGVETSAKIDAGFVGDLVVTTPAAIDTLTEAGKLVAGSRVNLVQSGVGVAVRAGAKHPDISTTAGFRAALLAAKSVGISEGPSGVYLMTIMQRLGIADQVKAKAVTPPLGQRVGNLIARGEAEIGVQQVTELLPISGIDFLGPLPEELQTKIGYATARLATAKEPQAAAAFVQFLASPAAVPVMKKMGLEPW
ncbi:MAG TPA: molybdate ABC transporter substrate-binding protein [Xanthobacteraceae bacterium]|nr:molybdate ABC transporter substrate-binding protein [Xanthobacteraceae bacterium]